MALELRSDPPVLVARILNSGAKALSAHAKKRKPTSVLSIYREEARVAALATLRSLRAIDRLYLDELIEELERPLTI